jgi:hypothetical protein
MFTASSSGIKYKANEAQDICCPVKMACYPTPLTPSNIYCCNSSETELNCDSSWTALPMCLPSYFACLAEEGGGCCPNNTLCSPNGCITTTGPATVTESPAATATIMKQGEVAQNGVGRRDSVVVKLCLPYSCISFLVFIAALMGFL